MSKKNLSTAFQIFIKIFRWIWRRTQRSVARPLELLHQNPVAVVLTGALLISISIIVDIFYNQKSSGPSYYAAIFLKELGFAFIVAWLVSITIEQAASKWRSEEVSNQLNAIKENVFSAVFNVRQPDEMIDLLNRTIFRKAFYRQQYSVNVLFEYLPVSGKPDMVFLDITSRFKAMNMTASPQKFKYAATIEIPYDRELANLAVLKSVSIDGVRLTDEQMAQAKANGADTDDFKRYAHEIPVLAKGSVTIVSNYTLVKHTRDALVWQVFDPCDGFRLTAVSPKDLVIYGDAIHPFAPAEKSGGKIGDAKFAIHVEQPLFPNHGVQLWWDKAPPTNIAEDRPTSDAPRKAEPG